MINNFGAFLGMGMLIIVVALFCYLAETDAKKGHHKRSARH